jgi:hypothetical protein
MQYQGMMLDPQGAIKGIRIIECQDDLTAVDAARASLERARSYAAVEIWRGDQRVGKVTKPAP